MTLAALHAVVYAKDLPRLLAFYENGIGLRRAGPDTTTDGFVVLTGDGFELSLVRVPPEIAATLVITTPPQAREDTPIKLSFLVDRLDGAREAVERLGGQLGPADAAWVWRGYRHLDGIDPEGNVFQLREVIDAP